MSLSSTPPRPRIRHARPRARGQGILLAHGWRLQRSIVTWSYAGNTRGASWAAHASYLARGARRDGAKGLGFDAFYDDVDLAVICRGWQRAGDVRLWKFVVSPEHGARLDLRAHTRALVEQLERDLGTRLEWAAVEHHNTDHPHVHLVVRGRAEGRPLEIAFTYLWDGLPARSSELATQVLGFRSEREHLAARGHLVGRARFTEIDRELLRRADDRGLVTDEGPRPGTRSGDVARLQELRRLHFLEGLGLATKVGAWVWRLLPTLESALRRAERADQTDRRRARRRARLADPRLPLVVTGSGAGGQSSGRAIAGDGRAPRLEDAASVPELPAVGRAEGAGSAGVGDVVPVNRRVPRRGGRQIGAETHDTATLGPSGRPTDSQAPDSLLSLSGMERTLGRAITILPPVEGLIYRGRLVGYGRGQDGQRYAVVDTGRELRAFRADDAELAVGRGVRASAHQAEADRRQLLWRLGADERERERG
ncbi:MAG: hypothetical protein DME17_07165 [Candidatus Rokuibacteriota bacterium]|nr:MAG: hypothetical protein DME17_07165 [Candidatus Rokubacteria bacterium]